MYKIYLYILGKVGNNRIQFKYRKKITHIYDWAVYDKIVWNWTTLLIFLSVLN